MTTRHGSNSLIPCLVFLVATICILWAYSKDWPSSKASGHSGAVPGSEKPESGKKTLISATSQLDEFGPEGLLELRQPGWHAASPAKYPQSLLLDFQQSKQWSLAGFLHQDKHPERGPKALAIEASNDKESWEKIAESDNVCSSNSEGGWHELKFTDAMEARYWKITIFSNCGDPTFLTLKGLKFQ